VAVGWRLCGVASVALGIMVSGCGGSSTSKDAASGSTTSTSKGKVPHLAKLPPATRTQHSRSTRYRPGTYGNMAEFLTVTLNRVDAFWSQVFANSNLSEPTVTYNWLAPGESAQPACSGGQTNEQTAAYCSLDDTIYIAQQMAINLWNGFLGKKEADVYPGAFGVAYVVAHEYSHNVQAELGIRPTGPTVKEFELEADCFAGVFANSEYYAGVLDDGDVEHAIALADLVGDYDFTNPQHHGTPAERVAAWRTGYDSGEPDTCISTFLP
jgi:predicted metalloprotease